MRLEQAGAIRIFTDVRSGKSMDRPGLSELLAFAGLESDPAKLAHSLSF